MVFRHGRPRKCFAVQTYRLAGRWWRAGLRIEKFITWRNCGYSGWDNPDIKVNAWMITRVRNVEARKISSRWNTGVVRILEDDKCPSCVSGFSSDGGSATEIFWWWSRALEMICSHTSYSWKAVCRIAPKTLSLINTYLPRRRLLPSSNCASKVTCEIAILIDVDW